jgi:hypothetical protein
MVSSGDQVKLLMLMAARSAVWGKFGDERLRHGFWIRNCDVARSVF